MTYRKKLIEVALPLEAINAESAREKSIRHGHPSTLHLWWARRPLAACRAVLWASLVDDPSSWPDKFPTEEEQEIERQRLFDILARFETLTDKKGNTKQVVKGLVSWDDIKEPEIIIQAQKEIARCLAWERGEKPPVKPDKVREYITKYAPPVYDPFAGGGSIPLEAQRLGLEAHASDLNPVAVLINKALIEIPPKFRDQPPVNPVDRQRSNIESWKGAQGLAADVRYYGQWMRDEAFEKIGHLYPKINIPSDHGEQEATVIAWIWARTVKCANPGCGCQMPLVKSFELSNKKGKEAWVEYIFDKSGKIPKITFEVKTGKGKPPQGTVDRKGSKCIACDAPIPFDYIRSEGQAGRMSQKLIAIVAEGKNGRVYLSANDEHEKIALSAEPKYKPNTNLPAQALGFRVQNYGMTKHADLFTNRQLVALTTFSDLVSEARDKVIQDAILAGLPDDHIPVNDGGKGANAYGDAIATYLAFGVSRMTNTLCTIARWTASRDQTVTAFARQAIPMTWDYPDVNPFSGAAGDLQISLSSICEVLEGLPLNKTGKSQQHDATATHPNDSISKLISTDPPYCLAPDTLIQTAKGYIPIQDIQIGDQVLTHKGQFSPVINTSKRWYEGNIHHLKIAGINHPLIITGEHPIYGIKTNPCGYQFSYCHPDCSYMKSQGRCRHQAFADYQLEWIPTSDLKTHDLIFVPTLATNHSKPPIRLKDYLPAGEYLEHNGLLHYQKATSKSLDRRKQESNTLCLDRQYTIPAQLKITPDLCRLIGFFIAEGYARLESDGGTIQFTLHWEEQNFKDDIIQLMQTCFHLSPGKTTDNRQNNNNSFRLNFYSKPITSLFRTWFYTSDGHKCLPQWVLELPPKYLVELIKGYWWGDGYRSNNGYKAVTVSPALAGQIQIILQKLNIRSCLHTRNVKNTIVNGKPVIPRHPQHNIIVNGPSLLKLASYIGEPKKETLSRNRFSQHGYWEENGYVIPIRKIETQPYMGYVYNLETLDHSYTTAMGCVHNCDNIGYADLSDFFYIWLRQSLGNIYPDICSTLLVPKAQELVSIPYRFEGSKQKAKDFFESGIRQAFSRMRTITHNAYPVTIFYAFKQQEEEGKKGEETIASTGWETMLEGLLQSGLTINATWPMRSELSNRMVASGTNALASSIVLVCRPRPENAPKTTRRQFLSELKRDLPQALKLLQQGNIAPVDLAQASIGPGMAIYSKYTAILESDGNPMRVRTALQLINQILDEFLTEQEGEFDTDTRWTLTWFEQHQFNDGLYGDAETLSKAKNTSIQGLVEAGILQAKAGKVRLLARDELKPNWQPQKDQRISIWEITQYLIHALDKNGETAAAELLAQIGQHERALARDLAYRLYSLCDRKSWTTEAIAYNSLVISWPEILRLANSITPEPTETQLTLI